MKIQHSYLQNRLEFGGERGITQDVPAFALRASTACCSAKFPEQAGTASEAQWGACDCSEI